MKYWLLGVYVCCVTLAQAQVDFNADDPQFFKFYGTPQATIYQGFKEAAKDKNALKINVNGEPIGKNIKKIGKWGLLQIAKFNNNGIVELPAEIGNLRELFIFVSRNNRLRYVSPAIAYCQSLMFLELGQVKLDSLPREMEQLYNLELLRIIENEADTFRFSDSLRGIPRLKSLQIVSANMYRFPNMVFKCKKIENLVLADCKIDSFPEALFYLPQLKEINLSGNNIKEIPRIITKMKQIEYLDLSNNKLTTIPEFIAYLPNLHTLNISGNQIPIEELDVLRVLSRYKFTLISDYEKLKAKQNPPPADK